MRALPFAALLLGAGALAADRERAAAGVQEELPQISPDERAGSSWRRMANLAVSRLRERAEALPMGSARAHELYRECVEDAWFLGEAAFVQGVRAPCARVLRSTENLKGAPGEPEEAAPAKNETAPPLGAATLVEFRRCAETAWVEGRPSLLGGTCAAALDLRAARLPERDDDRLAEWLGGCKAALTGGQVGTLGEERTAYERHCLRTLQILYDATGKQRLSDWWTPEELQKLQNRRGKK